MNDSKAQHPIQVVSRRTGLGLDLIRAWERRYGLVEPSRSETGRRLYTDADIERLILLRRATEGGRRISDVASLSDDQLRELLREDLEARDERPQTPRAPLQPPSSDLRPMMEAVAGLDRRRLERLLVGPGRAGHASAAGRSAESLVPAGG
mgnify:CR=1 FL=1